MHLRTLTTTATRETILSALSAADVRAQVRELDPGEEPLIEDYIVAGYRYLCGQDGYLNGFNIFEETYEWTVDTIDGAHLELPIRPLKHGTTVALTYGTDTPVAVDPTVFTLRQGDTRARLVRSYMGRWPHTLDYRTQGQYRATFTAGLGTDAEVVPDDLKQALRMLAAHWYRNRETIGSEGRTVGAEVPYGLKFLCRKYRLAKDHS